MSIGKQRRTQTRHVVDPKVQIHYSVYWETSASCASVTVHLTAHTAHYTPSPRQQSQHFVAKLWRCAWWYARALQFR